MKTFLAATLVLCAGALASARASAQTIVPANADRLAGFPFKNTSILKPPAGAKVAIIEFEDMECPVCAADAPIVRAAVVKYKLPYLRRDFPLTEIHIWSFDAAVTARYLQDNVSPVQAEIFRRDVFANQRAIASKDDLAGFTRRWFQAHNLSMPFVMDASGACRNEVKSDRTLGDRLGVHGTPCIFVVTQKSWVQVADASQLYHTIDLALAQTAAQTSSKTSGNVSAR
ncbi:MAG: thioredoxin domain-containing protein [Acidobacteriaceae bacterium]|jgi:protein-disulfide isomerase